MAVITKDMLAPKRPTATNKTSRDICRALAIHHAERGEVFMREAEIHGTGRRLDGWAMCPSWAKPCSIGYEVKISLADFERDEKWPEYLPYCERLFFVCPTGLLKPEQVDSRAGLVWVDEVGSLEVVKKVKKRQVEPQAFAVMVHRLLFKFLYPDGKTLALLDLPEAPQ